jgi:hypothetical protein
MVVLVSGGKKSVAIDTGAGAALRRAPDAAEGRHEAAERDVVALEDVVTPSVAVALGCREGSHRFTT